MRLDAAAYLGSWPFRAVEGTTRGLSGMMQELGLDHALVSSLPALFHADPEPANRDLLRRLSPTRQSRYGDGAKNRPELWAAPAVNLHMADAAGYISRLARDPKVRAVQLAPGFHGYATSQTSAGCAATAQPLEEVVAAVADAGLAAVIQLRMQDERSHPPTTSIPPVPIEEAIALAERVPTARIVVAAARQGELENRSHAERIRALPNLWLTTTHLDGVGCIRRACDAVGVERLLFGTCWPFFYAKSALLKAEEAELSGTESDLLMGGNARKAFGR